jgi:dihydroorotate dehydrogenase electron transfer subunit
MLWAVGRIAERAGIEAFLSLEEQMACGLGVCLGCATPAQSRPYRYVCKDGPVFVASEVMLHAPASEGGAS